MITITHESFMIENYLSVLFLSDSKVIIQTKKRNIHIIGSNLILNYYSSSEIRGSGVIQEVRFS